MLADGESKRILTFTVTGEWVGDTRMLNNAVLGSYAEEPQLDREHTLELESSGPVCQFWQDQQISHHPETR